MNVQPPKGSSELIGHPEQLVDIMQRVLRRENKIGRSQEHFWVVGLDQASKLLFIELIGLGRGNRVHADAPTIFRMAIYKMAVKVIFVHNHPSGQMEASQEDINLTDHQYKAGQILNIEVADHLIISEDSHLSFESEGLMAKIRASDSYKILTQEEQLLQQFKVDAEAERLANEKLIKVAKKLKSMGMEIEDIKKATGLRVGEIRKL